MVSKRKAQEVAVIGDNFMLPEKFEHALHDRSDDGLKMIALARGGSVNIDFCCRIDHPVEGGSTAGPMFRRCDNNL